MSHTRSAPWHFRLALAIVLSLSLSAGLVPFTTAFADSSTCNPGRTNSDPTDNWDGWQYSISSGYFTNASVDANTLLPYASSGDEPSVWSMLTGGSGSPNFAQVGYYYQADVSPVGWAYFVEWEDQVTGNTVPPLQVYPSGMSETPSGSNTYDTSYTGPYGSHNEFVFGFTIDGQQTLAVGGAADDNLYGAGSAIENVYLGGIAAMGVQIYGEYHATADQEFGAINDREDLYSSQYELNGSWSNLGLTPDQITLDESTGTYSQDPYVGYQSSSSGNIQIWDNGCPGSVSSGDQIPTNDYLDAAGTGADKLIVSSGGDFYASITTSGQFYVGEHDSQCSGCAKVLWYQPSYSEPDYLAMQSDDNLVLYNSIGGGALWQSGTSGRGYSNPYLISQNDGNLVLYGGSGVPLWDPGTNWASNVGLTGEPAGLVYGDILSNGHTLYSTNEAYHLSMQGDGNLVLYQGSTPLWQSGTSGDGSTVNLKLDTAGYMLLCDTGQSCNPSGSPGVDYVKIIASGGGSQNHMIVNTNGTFGWYTATGGTTWVS